MLRLDYSSANSCNHWGKTRVHTKEAPYAGLAAFYARAVGIVVPRLLPPDLKVVPSTQTLSTGMSARTHEKPARRKMSSGFATDCASISFRVWRFTTTPTPLPNTGQAHRSSRLTSRCHRNFKRLTVPERRRNTNDAQVG